MLHELQDEHHGLPGRHTPQHVHHKLAQLVVLCRNLLHHLNLLEEVGLLHARGILCIVERRGGKDELNDCLVDPMILKESQRD